MTSFKLSLGRLVSTQSHSETQEVKTPAYVSLGVGAVSYCESSFRGALWPGKTKLVNALSPHPSLLPCLPFSLVPFSPPCFLLCLFLLSFSFPWDEVSSIIDTPDLALSP